MHSTFAKLAVSYQHFTPTQGWTLRSCDLSNGPDNVNKNVFHCRSSFKPVPAWTHGSCLFALHGAKHLGWRLLDLAVFRFSDNGLRLRGWCADYIPPMVFPPWPMAFRMGVVRKAECFAGPRDGSGDGADLVETNRCHGSHVIDIPRSSSWADMFAYSMGLRAALPVLRLRRSCPL